MIVTPLPLSLFHPHLLGPPLQSANVWKHQVVKKLVIDGALGVHVLQNPHLPLGLELPPAALLLWRGRELRGEMGKKAAMWREDPPRMHQKKKK